MFLMLQSVVLSLSTMPKSFLFSLYLVIFFISRLLNFAVHIEHGGERYSAKKPFSPLLGLA